MPEEILTVSFIISILAFSVRMMPPALFAALGEIFAERSGVLNLGIEGVMLIGAFTAFATAYFTNNVLVGVLSAIVAGCMIGMLAAFMSVTLCVDQIVSGIGIWFLGLGLSSFLFKIFFGSFTSYPSISILRSIPIPGLTDAPIIGTILFNHNLLVYLILILPPACWAILFKTTAGLKVRSVGENPKAADSLGINVFKVRYITTILAGAFAAIGGAYLTLGYLGTFTINMSAGRGFIALAIVILSKWNPISALGGAFLFGALDALQIRLQAVGLGIPYQFLLMLPYIVTLIVLVTTTRKAGTPAALTIPYRRS
jgi:simple sugar transport system permease protein